MPTLSKLNGDEAGRHFDLHREQTLLGRSADCDIVLPELGVSRRHALIVRDAGGFAIEDLGSLNGTVINGQRIERRQKLKHRDLIELAGALLRFDVETSDAAALGPTSAPDERDASPDDGQSSVDYAPAHASAQPPLFLATIDAVEELRFDVNPAAKLQAVLELTQQLGGTLDIEEVLPRMLDSFFALFPQAERGYVLLAGQNEHDLRMRALRYRNEPEEGAPTLGPYSRTIANEVMHHRRAILSSDALSDQRFEKSRSVIEFEIRSMMCAPLIGPTGRALGLLYLDTQDLDHEFVENDLDLMVSALRIAAQAIELAQTHASLLQVRREAEESVRRSEMRFRAVWENSADAMRLTDGSGTVVAVNRAYCQLVGLPADELIGWPFTAAYTGEQSQPALEEYEMHFRGRSFPRREEVSLTFRPSRTLELVVTHSLLEIESQNTLLLSIFHDITEKKRAEAALQDSELRFQTIFQDAALGIALADLRGRILRTNPALEQLLGFEKSQLVGLMATEVLDPSVRARFRTDLQELVAGGSEAMQRELRCQRRDGTKLWGSLTLSLFRDSGGRPAHVIAMIEDITDRKGLERDLADLTFQEQQRIGQEVHDGIGQELTGLGYLAGTLHRKLSERGGPESQIAGQLSEGLSRALAQARAVARGLMPVDVDAGGLEHALDELTRRVCGWFDIECQFVSRGAVVIQNRSAVNHLYRIAQEAVTNAVKHGKAKQVTIELSGDEEQTRLRITDDGRGFGSGSDEPSGMGMRIMHYRADMIGADLNVSPRPEGGVIITCTFSNGSLPAD